MSVALVRFLSTQEYFCFCCKGDVFGAGHFSRLFRLGAEEPSDRSVGKTLKCIKVLTVFVSEGQCEILQLQRGPAKVKNRKKKKKKKKKIPLLLKTLMDFINATVWSK
jgi:hypothetical protein